MPYVTSMERIAEARGESRGRVQGLANMLLKQLGRVCGPVPEDLAQRVGQLPATGLEALGEALLDFHTVQDVEAWLDKHGKLTQ